MINENKLLVILSEEHLLTYDQAEDILKLQSSTGQSLINILFTHTKITEDQIIELLSRHYHIPFIDLSSISIDESLYKILPYMLIQKHNVVPIKKDKDKLYLVMENPLDISAIDDIKKVYKHDIVPAISYRRDIQRIIRRIYSNDNVARAVHEYEQESNRYLSSNHIQSSNIVDNIDNSPVVKLVNSIIDDAIVQDASDIHIEPYESYCRIRFRIDGSLINVMTIPKNIHSPIVSRIKVMSRLNIADSRMPQDGRIQAIIKEENIDLRVAIMPTIHGEKIVLRILNRAKFLIPKSQLGFTDENLARYNSLLKHSHGIILVTGPAGSGKTTTLYTMLTELNKDSKNIITIEDPVEFVIEGINQIQVNNKAGLDFATGLRSILRQDPDIIMLGEIRDVETAQIAIKAAITGHLVLSTIHTNNTVSTISRLLDMGIEPYLIAASVTGIISQRLLKKVCIKCSQLYVPKEEELRILNISNKHVPKLVKPIGCQYCNFTGYKGRVAIHEIIQLNKSYRNIINSWMSEDQLLEHALKNGISTLKDECTKLLADGITSLEEVTNIMYSNIAY